MEKMYKGKTFVALIAARGGSKGIKLKNIRPLAGQPLISWTIQAAKGSRLVDSVFVITDHKQIASVASQQEVEVISEPAKLATDHVQQEPVWMFGLKELQRSGRQFDYAVILQPTSPLRDAQDVDKAIKKLVDSGSNSLLSVTQSKKFIWDASGKPINYDFKKRPLRQQMTEKDQQYAENGAIYIIATSQLLKTGARLGGKIAYHIMPEERSIDIDTEEDLRLAGLVLRGVAPSPKRVAGIRLLVLDVDGVMTDGGTYWGPHGEVTKHFNKRDGKGIELWRGKGGQVAIITGETGPIIRSRAKQLGISHLYLGNKQDKLAAYEQLKMKLNLKDEQIAYVGDDVQDVSLLNKVGLAFCPSDATPEAKAAVDYVCDKPGGGGCVREITDILLRKRS